MLGVLQIISLLVLYPQQKKTEGTAGVSVVICSRNNVEDLKLNLPHILNQAYPTFEIIVVNDTSEDQTMEYLKELSSKNPNLKIVDLPKKEYPGKKFALQKGIELAEHSYILVTDADCKPVSVNWIRSYASLMEGENTIILGYGKYEKRKGLLNIFIRIYT